MQGNFGRGSGHAFITNPRLRMKKRRYRILSAMWQYARKFLNGSGYGFIPKPQMAQDVRKEVSFRQWKGRVCEEARQS